MREPSRPPRTWLGAGGWSARASAWAVVAVAGLVIGSSMATAAAVVDSSAMMTTVAGTGAIGYSGDGGPASRAQLHQPRDTDVGPDGSLYIADTLNNVIRRVAPDGAISTFAGTGVAGFSGDGGAASEAMLHWPHDVVVDQSTGDVYIADSNNNRIRRVTPAGIIATFAGTGRCCFSGDGKLATKAKFYLPKSVALYGGSLFVADGKNHRIRAINMTTAIVRTVVGTGVAGFSGDGGPATAAMINLPQRIAIDSLGNIYLTDTKNNRIREVDVNGVITTVAGTGVFGFDGDYGAAVDAALRAPRGIAVRPDGSVVYFSDTQNNRVRQIDMATGIVSTLAGTLGRAYAGDGGSAGAASLYNPRGLTLDPQGRLIIADKGHNVVRVVTP